MRILLKILILFVGIIGYSQNPTNTPGGIRVSSLSEKLISDNIRFAVFDEENILRYFVDKDSLQINPLNYDISEFRNENGNYFIRFSDLEEVAFTGDYNDLLNLPIIPDITGLASETYVDSAIGDLDSQLSEVAKSGDYNDLDNKPTIPEDLSDLSDTTNLLFSKDYEDLTNKPSIPEKTSDLENDSGFITSADIPGDLVREGDNISVLINDVGYTTNTGTVTSIEAGIGLDGGTITTSGTIDLSESTILSLGRADTAVQLNQLSEVAISGSYTDLEDLPTIPTNVSQLTNDSGYLTEVEWGDIEGDQSDVNISGFENDAGYLTSVTLPGNLVKTGDNISLLNNNAGYTSNTGTVTSVSVAVPTGFTIGGNPITNAGTITIAYGPEYRGFTIVEGNKLAGIQAGAEVNVQADWAETDSTKDSYIHNKPVFPGPGPGGDIQFDTFIYDYDGDNIIDMPVDCKGVVSVVVNNGVVSDFIVSINNLQVELDPTYLYNGDRIYIRYIK